MRLSSQFLPELGADVSLEPDRGISFELDSFEEQERIADPPLGVDVHAQLVFVLSHDVSPFFAKLQYARLEPSHGLQEGDFHV